MFKTRSYNGGSHQIYSLNYAKRRLVDSKLSFVDVLTASIDDSDPSIPIFFILSPGADPVKEVEKVIKKDRDKYRIEAGKSFFNIALGQGQD